MEVLLNEILGGVMELNVGKCQRMELSEVSCNGMFGACHRLKCWNGMFACVMECNVRSSNLIKCWEMS